MLIYILELENKKYYVGKTTNPDFRLEQHFNNSGSQWTKKYKPIKVRSVRTKLPRPFYFGYFSVPLKI